MRWDIGEKVRAHIVGFSGVNFSGERWEVDIWPHGGRQGDEIDGRRVKSIGIIAPYGTRMILMAARPRRRGSTDPGDASRCWRARPSNPETGVLGSRSPTSIRWMRRGLFAQTRNL